MATYYFRNTGDVNWGTASNWSLTDGGGATGAVPTAADDAYFTSNSGNCTINTSARVCKTLVFSGVGAGNYAGTITMTNGITVSGNVTLSATMTIAGASGLTVNAAASLNFNGKTWSNAFTFVTGPFTVTLLSDLNIAGLLTFNSNTTINGTYNINCSGGITMGANAIKGTGTPTLNLYGGTWSGSGRLSLNTNINGNITVSGTVGYDTGTLTYIAGTVTTTGSTLSIAASTTFNTNGMVWDNVTETGTFTVTNNSLFTMSGNFSHGSGAILWNGSNINIGGNLTMSGGGITNGTSTFVMVGNGSLNNGSGTFQNNITFNTNGTINIISFRCNTGTYTYLSGKIIADTITLTVTLSSTFINFDKINFKAVTITAGTTQTMNKFFSGSARIPTRISSAGANYTIAFQDGFEKITKFIRISNCTLSRPGQLLCITPNSNKGGNLGVRYINQLPNGVPKNAPTVAAAMAYSVANISDPNFIIN